MNNLHSKNIAFFDAEFTSKSVGKDKGNQELIQFAILVCKIEKLENLKFSISSKPIFVYQTYVKPTLEPTLTTYIKSLTNITQKNVDGGIELADAIDKIYEILTTHKVSKIFVWGPDRLTLKNNCLLAEVTSGKSKYICNKIKDVSDYVSKQLYSRDLLSQSKVCNILQIEEKGRPHDAYCDAFNLFQIISKLIKTTPSSCFYFLPSNFYKKNNKNV